MLRARDITVRHGGRDVEALSRVSCAFEPGSIHALVGANGSGKSTLARVLCAMSAPYAGSVSLDGADAFASVDARRAHRQAVGIVQQDPVDQLVTTLVHDEVAFGPRNLGLDSAEVERRVHESLDIVGLADATDRAVSTLSGGEQQRLALAGVLAMRPRFLVLDEVTSQLDPIHRSEVRELMLALAHREGIGLVVVTHDPLEMAIADRLTILDGGRIAWTGSPADAIATQEPLLDTLVMETPYLKALRCALGAGADVRAVMDPDALGSWLLGHPGAATGLRDALGPLTASGRGAGEGGVSLALEGVTYRYPGQAGAALIDATLNAGAGELVLVAGCSGSGKSTLAAIAAGLVEPDSGRAAIGADPVEPGRCAIAFQRPEDQLFLPTARDELAFAPLLAGASSAEAEAAALVAARRSGFPMELLDSSPFELSGGEARRLAIGCALSQRPRALILDEPTAGLDAPGRRALHGLVRDLLAEGLPIVVVSHDVEEWMTRADRVALMSRGQVVWYGPTVDLAAEPHAFEVAGLPIPAGLLIAAILADAAGSTGEGEG
ncbi:MAG: ATP-binding cassette domain-containing protein [Collinsella sp.]|nr:ATP-binding cassette domain-containing protein [Collinsella sp.]